MPIIVCNIDREDNPLKAANAIPLVQELEELELSFVGQDESGGEKMEEVITDADERMGNTRFASTSIFKD